jgi:bifunctional polynucleotide phosphatase/kinase
MWQIFEQKLMDEEQMNVNIQESFYCGDSAGRTTNPHTKQSDFSDSDLKFALNVGLNFKVPEELFTPQKVGKLPDLKKIKAYQDYLTFAKQHYQGEPGKDNVIKILNACDAARKPNSKSFIFNLK